MRLWNLPFFFQLIVELVVDEVVDMVGLGCPGPGGWRYHAVARPLDGLMTSVVVTRLLVVYLKSIPRS